MPTHHKSGPLPRGNDFELTANPIEEDATEAMALAKRMQWIGFRDVREHAVDGDDARAMLNTCEIRRILAEDGHNPR
jgi:hypothetical protein